MLGFPPKIVIPFQGISLFRQSYLSRLSRSGLAERSSGVRYTTGTPGVEGLSAKMTRSPEEFVYTSILIHIKSTTLDDMI